MVAFHVPANITAEQSKIAAFWYLKCIVMLEYSKQAGFFIKKKCHHYLSFEYNLNSRHYFFNEIHFNGLETIQYAIKFENGELTNLIFFLICRSKII